MKDSLVTHLLQVGTGNITEKDNDLLTQIGEAHEQDRRAGGQPTMNGLPRDLKFGTYRVTNREYGYFLYVQGLIPANTAADEDSHEAFMKYFSKGFRKIVELAALVEADYVLIDRDIDSEIPGLARYEW